MNKLVMNKKVVIWAAVVILCIILIFIIFRPKKVVYSDDPEDWIDEKPNGTFEVSFEQVTKGAGTFNDINEQYQYALIDTVFGYDGLYEGEYFKNKYYSPDRKIRMEITKNLVPGDGILQGIIIERIDDGQPVAFIFIDEDWRNKLGDTVNIVWGKKYQNMKKFEYKEIEDGIYMNQILDDNNRFIQTFNDVHFGGIVVGNVNIKDVQEGNTDRTVIMLS